MSESKKKRTSLWDTHPMRIMITGIVLGILICAGIFTFLGVYMNSSSNQAMNEMGQIYMSGLGRQVALRYNAVLDQRIIMMDALYQTNKPDDTHTISKETLEREGDARGFNYLAFMDAKGNLEMVYGDQLVVTDPEPFITSLNRQETKIAVATSRNTEGQTTEHNIVMFAIYTESGYLMESGEESIALVGGISNGLVVEMMLGTDTILDGEQRFNTHIIRRRGGSYVIYGENDESDGNHVHYNDYFEQLRYGFDLSPEDAEEHINVMQKKMDDGEMYSAVINSATSRKHLYGELLNHSEWYLVTVMEYSMLDGIVGTLGSQWTLFAVFSCIGIILVMLMVFSIYFTMTRNSMKQLELARQEAIAANKAKSEFLSNMSHDIRTPMNAIVGMTAIATANINNQQQVQDCLKKIALSSKHLLGLINDVLDMSKIESGKMTLNMEQLCLSEVIEGIATIVQPQVKIKRQRFDIFIHDIHTEKVYCDSVRLNQVMLNLLSNAIKFTPEEGSISVSIEQENSPLGDNYVRTHIHVKDTGIGMSPEFRKKIFESFTREDSARVHKTEGTGLGMAITKYIVDAMHGSITVESEPGKGTHFHVVLDLEKATIGEEEMILPEWKMLLVDDDTQLCETTAKSLASIGVKAEWTLDGESAIEKAVTANGKNTPYDVILMDWKLPGIDGIETARRLRKELGENIPILLISAYDWSEIETEAREAGISGFIAKPLFKSTLFYGLKKYTSEDTAKAEPAQIKQDGSEWEGLHILLAEDNDLNWEIAELLLTSIGMIVDRAENGQICVDMLNNSVPGTYKAILMDIRMPVLSGTEATERIRKLDHPDAQLPIIAMTADAFSDDIKKCLDVGMNAHIAKPIDIEIIKSTLAKFLFAK